MVSRSIAGPLRLGWGAALSWLCVGSTLQQSLADPSDHYVYAIYYGSDNCADRPGTMRGYASDQNFEINGRSAANRMNETDEWSDEDLCTLESVCLVQEQTKQCKANDFVKVTDALFSISEEGLIYECDTTNPDAECAFKDPECYSSSTFPHCHFQIVTTSTLVKKPTAIKHSDPLNDRTLDDTSYILYYSDEACQNFEGLEGIVNNATNIVGSTSDSISCRDAIFCVLHPESDDLGKVCQDLLGVDTPPNLELKMMPISDEGQPVPCDPTDAANCAPVPPDSCLKSTLHPSCYTRVLTAATFFGDPATFLPNYIPDAPATSGGGGDGAAPTDASATNPPSAAAVHFSVMAIVIWAVVTILAYP